MIKGKHIALHSGAIAGLTLLPMPLTLRRGSNDMTGAERLGTGGSYYDI